MPFLDSLGSSQFSCRPPPPCDDVDLATSTPLMIGANRSYGIALFADGLSVGWGQGLCGERLPDHRDSSSAIASDGATKRRHDALRDSELVETQSLCSPSTCSGNGNSSHSGQPLPLPRFLRGARLRLTSVACGSGHVIAAVSGGGVISWGSGALGPSNELGEQQLRVLGLAGCRAPPCSHCRATASGTTIRNQPRRVGESSSSSSSRRSSRRSIASGDGRSNRKPAMTATGAHEDDDDMDSDGRSLHRASLNGRSDETGGLPVGSNQRVWWVLGLRRKICLAVAAGENYSAALCLEDSSDGIGGSSSSSGISSSSTRKNACGGGGCGSSGSRGRGKGLSHSRKQTSLWTWGNGECGQLGLGLTVVKSTAAAQAANAQKAWRINGATLSEDCCSDTATSSSTTTVSSSITYSSTTYSSTSSSTNNTQGSGGHIEPPKMAPHQSASQALDGAGGCAQRAWAAAPSPFTVSCAPQRVAFPVGNDKDDDDDYDDDDDGNCDCDNQHNYNGNGDTCLIRNDGIAFSTSAGNNDDSDPDEALASGVDEPQPASISCGPFHAACVDRRGYLYTWGSGTRGQLGHGSCTDAWAPQLVQSLLGVGHLRKDGTSGGIAVPSKQAPGLATIACGLWHTAAVSDSGDLYTWGWGRFGQLGYSNVEEEGGGVGGRDWDCNNSAAAAAATEDEDNGRSEAEPGREAGDDEHDEVTGPNISSRGRLRPQGAQQDERRVRQRTRAAGSSSAVSGEASCENLVQRWPRLVKVLEDPVIGVVAGSRHTVALSRTELPTQLPCSDTTPQTLHIFGALGPTVEVDDFSSSTTAVAAAPPAPPAAPAAAAACARSTTGATSSPAASAASEVQDQSMSSSSLTWSTVTGVLTDGTAPTPAPPSGHTQVSARHVAVALPPEKGLLTALGGGPWHVVWGASTAGTPLDLPLQES